MSIRAKTTLFVLLTFAITVGLLAALQARSSLARFSEIETGLAVEDASRVVRQFDSYLADLAGTNADWAYWDDTYRFVKDGNDLYRDTNIFPGAFSQIGVDLVVFADASGTPVHGAWYTPDGEERAVPAGLLSSIAPDAGAFGDFRDDPRASHTGIVEAGRRAFLVTTRAVLRSDKTGPPAGVLLMAREVDDAFAVDLASLVNLRLTIRRCLGGCDELGGAPVVSRNADTVSTDSAILSPSGAPVLGVRVDGDRSIYLASVAGLRRMMLIVIGVGIIAGLVTVAGIHRLVIARLSRLGRTVSEVEDNDDPSIRAVVEGGDEIGRLADGVNSMLASLEASRDELVEAKRRVDQASGAKSRFLAHMSHEIRTPLNAVLAYGQLLQLDAVDAESRDSADQIVRAARHVTDLLEEFLDVARIEAGAIPLDLSDIDADAVVGEVVELSRPLAVEAGATIEHEPADGCRALADAVRLRQVVLNLISNAVKYGGSHGPITVRTSTADEVVSIDVANLGPGIPDELLDRLFVPFDRLEADQGSQKGSGIGLAVTKQLVELMHGTIEVSSGPGRGARFTVALPTPNHDSIAGSAAIPEPASV